MKITTAQDLAAAVRGRRAILGLSQAELATRAGVSRPWVSKVEAGKPTVEFHMVIRLLDALGLSLDLIEAGGAPEDASTAPFDLDTFIDEYRNR